MLYHHGNHPVKWVRLTGVIVAADEFAGRRVYTVDDSSGMCIECTAVAPPDAKSAINIPIPRHLNQLVALNKLSMDTIPNTAQDKTEAKNTAKLAPSVQEPQIPWEQMDVGVVVKVKGKIGEFRATKQIEVIKIDVMNGLDAEVKCWNEIMVFRTNVLSMPWTISEEEEERCRRVKEKEMKRAKRGSREGKEKDEARRKRKEKERREKAEEDDTARKEREANMLPPPPPPKRKMKYPSLAVRKAAAGKYDALGI